MEKWFGVFKGRELYAVESKFTAELTAAAMSKAGETYEARPVLVIADDGTVIGDAVAEAFAARGVTVRVTR